MVDRAVLDVIEREIADEVRTRFPGDAVQRVRLLQYGLAGLAVLTVLIALISGATGPPRPPDVPAGPTPGPTA